MSSFPEKPVPTDLPILAQMKRRWSPVSYAAKSLTPDQIATLFEAARWAPSAFNEQPWRYIYATKDDGDVRAALESLLVPGNAWAKDAHLLIISFAKKTFAKNGKPNRHHMHDLGCASGYMVLQAVELGLIGHQMSGFDHTKANAMLGVPDDFEPGSMIAIGYASDAAAIKPEALQREQSPRTRNEQDVFVFRGKWEK